jgi:hypothetical protein
MPGRSSSSGRSSSFSRSSSYSSRSSSKPSYSYSSPKSPVSTPATYTTPSSVVNHNHQVQQPGFFSNMWQGFGLGAGQSIAMNIFRSDPKVTHVHENAPSSSITPVVSSETFYSKEFTQCLKDKWDDKETCKQYIQCLKDNKDDKSLCTQYM